jgi:Cu/Ag efflux pump CusA
MSKRLFTPACALVLALLAAPCLAVTAVKPATVQASLKQGVVEQLGAIMRIAGKPYAFSAATTVVYDRQGARVSASRLTLGQTVAFSLADDSKPARIKELWIVE